MQDLPNQHFLDEVFAKLSKKKQATHEPTQNIPVGTVYQGFKTIPIQKLDLKQENKGKYINGKSLWNGYPVTELYIYRQNSPLSFEHENGFFKAFHEAYIKHGEVKITPDDVWLIIMIYFSNYVLNHAQKLRKAFVNHEGKIQLVVRTVQLGEKNWEQFLEKVIVSIKENTVKGVTEQLQSNFSSTDQFSRLFSTVAMMNTYQKYFDYTNMVCICGITNIHMGGTQEDWENLYKKLGNLEQFDVDGELKLYVKNLRPVLDQFIETYKGNAHIQFWNNIYHQRENPHQNPYSPKRYINGWIIRFFTTYETLGDKVSLEDISVPVKQVNEATKQEKHLHIVGGCRGVSVENGKVYRPHYSFAVVQKNKNL